MAKATRAGAGRAFTLIELLIVVAIIAIMAALAVPNFLEAQTRAKVARIHADMHTLAVAIEAYWFDNRAYPPNIAEFVVVGPNAAPDEDNPVFWGGRVLLEGDRWLVETERSVKEHYGGIPSGDTESLMANGLALWRVTTPVAYLTILPQDVFVPNWIRGYSYGYGDTGGGIKEQWSKAIKSVRPFGYLNLTAIEPDGLQVTHFGRTVQYVLTSPGPQYVPSLTDVSTTGPVFYDPTNGAVSRGDIILHGAL